MNCERKDSKDLAQSTPLILLGSKSSSKIIKKAKNHLNQWLKVKRPPDAVTTRTVTSRWSNVSICIRRRSVSFSLNAIRGKSVCSFTLKLSANLLMAALGWTVPTSIQNKGSNSCWWTLSCSCSKWLCQWWWCKEWTGPLQINSNDLCLITNV
jgi:hypothetical protein